jgi:hypothetical protein
VPYKDPERRRAYKAAWDNVCSYYRIVAEWTENGRKHDSMGPEYVGAYYGLLLTAEEASMAVDHLTTDGDGYEGLIYIASPIEIDIPLPVGTAVSLTAEDGTRNDGVVTSLVLPGARWGGSEVQEVTVVWNDGTVTTESCADLIKGGTSMTTKRGSFDIPCQDHVSTRGAKLAYEAFYQRVWPHDDAYLRELARETREHYPSGGCQFLLNLMRECDSQ